MLQVVRKGEAGQGGELESLMADEAEPCTRALSASAPRIAHQSVAVLL